MAPSSALVMLRRTLLPFDDFLWILQKEEYETARYFYWLKRFFFRRNFVVSEKLIYTLRAKVTLGVAVLLWLGSLLSLFVPIPSPTVTVAIVHSLVWIVQECASCHNHPYRTYLE